MIHFYNCLFLLSKNAVLAIPSILGCLKAKAQVS